MTFTTTGDKRQAVLLLSLAAVLLSVQTTGASDGGNWPDWRGPTSQGHSDATGLPLKWSETENIVWKVSIHDHGYSTPVVWGDQIWLTTATEDGKRMSAICVDRPSGEIVHDLLVFENENPRFCHATNSYASPTPIVEEGRVYVHFGSYGTAWCLHKFLCFKIR